MSELRDTNVVRGNGRKILIILAIIFLLPFTIAAVLHLLHVKPGGHSYGDLVKPPVSLKFPVLHDVLGKPFDIAQWEKKWNIVTIDANGCAETCQARLHILKQVHTSLGKETHRVQRLLLVPAEMKGQALNELQEKYPDLIILIGADADTSRFAEEFNLADKSEGRIYLVDPLGNLMMTYPENVDPKGLRSDLTRLLKNSWAG